MDYYDTNRITARTLDNGLQIYVNERRLAPVVSVQVWVETGSIHEEEYLGCGLSHFLEHMLFHGSARFSGEEIVNTVHRLGGDMNAYTSLGHTVYYIEMPARHAVAAIDLLADMVAYPAFPEDKFADEKKIILRERDMHGDNPSRFVSEKLWHEMFKIHPARHPIIGYREKILGVNRDMMSAYHQRRYSPERTFFLVSGQVEPEAMIDAVAARLMSWPRGGLREAVLPAEPPQLSRREAQYRFPDPLARLSLSWHIPPVGHADIPALDILCAILGQNKSSRLVHELKIRRNLAVEVSSFCFTPSFCGLLGLSLLAEPAKLAQLERTLQVVLENTLSGTFSRNELKREVTQLSTEYLRAMRSNSSITRILGNSIMSFGSTEYVRKYLDDLDHVTVDDLHRVAIKYLLPENSTVVRVVPPGPAAAGSVLPAATAAAPDDQPQLRRDAGGRRLVTYCDPSLPLIDLVLILP
ncbi:MAG: pitrilysin family protein, partial [Victivallales bacterium]|nr:pitrilysin family protein [Victivallales bacterium]